MPKTLVQLGVGRDSVNNYTVAAHDLGYEIVLVESERAQNLIERTCLNGGAKFDDVVLVKSSTPSAIREAVLRFARSKEVILVFPGFEHYSVVAAELRRILNLASYSSVEAVGRFRHKDLQRIALQGKVRQPRFAVCCDSLDVRKAISQIGLPSVLKLADAGGSQAVTKLRTTDEIDQTVARFKETVLDDGNQTGGVMLVEQLIEGPEIGVQGVVDASGETHLFGITKKTIHGGPAGTQFLERRHVALGAGLVDPALSDFAHGVLSALSLRGSAFHMDVRLSSDGPVLIEAGARLSGAGVPLLLAEANGWTPGIYALQAWLGKKVVLPPSVNRICGQEFFFPAASGKPQMFSFEVPQTHSDERVSAFLFLDHFTVAAGYNHISDRVGAVRATASEEHRVHELLDGCLSGLHLAMSGGDFSEERP